MVFFPTRQLGTRERLLQAAIDAVAEQGYATVAVEDFLRHAGASRSTFYEQFTDKDHCFLVALEAISNHLLRDIELALRTGEGHRAHEVVIRALSQFAVDQLAAARALFSETLAAGPRALDARERLIGELERIVEQRWEQADGERPLTDISARALIGGVFRILAARSQRGEGAMHGVLEDLLGWVSAYEIDVGEPRWRRLWRCEQLTVPAQASYSRMPQPKPLPRGRHKLSATEVARNQRDRILYAIADLAAEIGYAETTVSDICRRSRVSRKVFYSHYLDKQAAALEAQELGFQQTTAVAAKAFFSANSWPERIWRTGEQFIRFLIDYPAIAHLGFIESQAIGAAAIQRIEDARGTFAIFLQEGYCRRTVERAPPELAGDAIAATAFELFFCELRHRRIARLPSLLPEVTYLCLTPFLGSQETNRFIDGKLLALKQAVPQRAGR